MQSRKKAAPKLKKPFDTYSGKRGRGRPPSVPASWVFGRASNYRVMLEYVWPRLREPLLRAQTDEEVTKAFTENAAPYVNQFVPTLAPLILRVLREPKFPKREPKLAKRKPKSGKPKANPRIVFLADSIAGLGQIKPRTSRDVCARERARAKSAHHITRWEFYIQPESCVKRHGIRV